MAEKQEESLPLLLLFLEDGGSPRRKNGIFIDNKSRYTRISEGAGNVLTQWPGQVSTCWLSSLVFLLGFFLILIILFAISFHPPPILSRCSQYKLNENNTRIYLVHHGFWDHHQLEVLDLIASRYAVLRIDLLQITNSTTELRDASLEAFHNPNVVVSKRSINSPQSKASNLTSKQIPVGDLNINIGSKNVIRNITTVSKDAVDRNLIRGPKVALTLQELLEKHSNVKYRNSTLEKLFFFTPLHAAWTHLNMHMAEFAVRVIKLWEYGGLSFKLEPEETKREEEDFNLLLMKSTLQNFQNLPDEVVNTDENGIHMETKTPCHAFFGELLANLRKCTENSTVEEVLSKTLKTFCARGSVTDKYCAYLD